MTDELQSLLATHAAQLQKLLPPHLWPIQPIKTEDFGPLTKYTLGEDQPGVWAMLHHLREPDAGAPHDHPCDFHTFIIAGGYTERLYAGPGAWRDVPCYPGSERLIAADCVHQILYLHAGESWSLCFAGPVVRDWQHYPELV